MISTSNPDKTLNSKFKILNSLFSWSWRLAILSLPWQTRWFTGANLAGWPWEQGKVSIYISFLPMVAAIVIAQFLPKQALSKKPGQALFFLVTALGLATVANNLPDIRPAIAWWLQIILLLSFFTTLIRVNVKLKQVLTWFVIALIPHAVFALAQAYLQYIPGHAWLGVAPQASANLGASVVQTDATRFLRAYGGFPHPNILGGFMAFAILITSWLYLLPFNSPKNAETNTGPKESRSPHRKRHFVIRDIWNRVIYPGALPIFSAALFYSFSRSAWLALAMGTISLIILTFITENARRTKGIIAFAAVIITILTLSIIHRDLTLSRLGLSPNPARLEVQSISDRAQSIQNGINLFQAHPLLGTGPNTELKALAQLKTPLAKEGIPNEVRRERIQPPHNTWLLMLANFGIVGALFIFGFLLFLMRLILKQWSTANHIQRNLLISLIATWLVISIFDYYLWAFWSGQLLSILTLFTIIFWLNNSQNSTQAAGIKNQQSKLDGNLE
ncbi:hypothetical protein GF391_03520 [Candidatus Uhrbacteria bacterium]|nr:hypothetical protein [Candidatus Uhrbacteria bacterium]